MTPLDIEVGPERGPRSFYRAYCGRCMVLIEHSWADPFLDELELHRHCEDVR